MLECADREPESLDHQIGELLDKLTADIETWRAVCNRYEVDVFVASSWAVTTKG